MTVEISWLPTLAAVKALMSPEPLAARPVVVLLFVQLKVVPAVPEKTIVLTELPAQTLISVGFITTGLMTVIVKSIEVPTQLPAVGVTVICATLWFATFAAAKDAMSPVPLAVRPMLVLSFVQLNVGLPVPVKLTVATVPFGQTVMSATGSIVGAVGSVRLTLTGGVVVQPFSKTTKFA